jgi:putative pyridoxal-dependent aspartate 1-decarboxylase
MDIEDLKKKYFLSPTNEKEIFQWMEKALQMSIAFLANRGGWGLHSDISLPELESMFSDGDFPEKPAELQAVLQETFDTVIRHSVHVSNPNFIGHMTGASPYFGLIVDLLTSALNQNLVKIETALSGSFVEGQTTAWLHSLVYKKPSAFYSQILHNPNIALGNVTSGGTIGNLTALTVARNLKFPRVAQEGLAKALNAAGYEDICILAGKRVHYSIQKVAGVLGIGTNQVFEIPVEKYSNKVSLSELKNTILKLKNSKTCILAIVGIAGSTETGSIDDLNSLADIAEENGIWFHVDAAWGGALLLSPTHQKLLNGIQRADSVVIDGHKAFYVPLAHGAVLFRDESALDAIRHCARYIIRSGSVDLGRTSLEGSRRFNSFKMWFFLKVLGREGYATLVDSSVKLTERFAELINLHPCFEQTSAQESNILTYRFLPTGWKQRLDTLRQKIEYARNTQDTLKGSEELEKMLLVFSFVTTILNELNIELQKKQRQAGKSFVSRTTLESVDSGFDTVVLRAVPFNPLTTPTILTEILFEQEVLGEDILKKLLPRFNSANLDGFDVFFGSP